jgi:hypothetical protein
VGWLRVKNQLHPLMSPTPAHRWVPEHRTATVRGVVVLLLVMVLLSPWSWLGALAGMFVGALLSHAMGLSWPIATMFATAVLGLVVGMLWSLGHLGRLLDGMDRDLGEPASQQPLASDASEEVL